jgi:hypothetical protein
MYAESYVNIVTSIFGAISVPLSLTTYAQDNFSVLHSVTSLHCSELRADSTHPLTQYVSIHMPPMYWTELDSLRNSTSNSYRCNTLQEVSSNVSGNPDHQPSRISNNPDIMRDMHRPGDMIPFWTQLPWHCSSSRVLVHSTPRYGASLLHVAESCRLHHWSACSSCKNLLTMAAA